MSWAYWSSAAELYVLSKVPRLTVLCVHAAPEIITSRGDQVNYDGKSVDGACLFAAEPVCPKS